MTFAIAVWLFPWYSLGFALLAFLQRWYWLLVGGLLAFALTVSQFHAIAQDEAEGAEIGVVVMVFVATGLASGFLARAVVLVGIAQNWRCRRELVILPAVFITGYIGFLGYCAIR